MSIAFQPGPDPDQAAAAVAAKWKWFVAGGVIGIVAGIAAFAWPLAASVTIAVLIGWVLVIGAGFQLFAAFAGGGLGRVLLRLALAAVSLIAGIWLISQPMKGTVTLTVLLVSYFIVFGIMHLLAYFANRDAEGAGSLAVMGVLQLILGLLIGQHLPSSANWAIGLLVGISFVMQGTMFLMLGLAGRRASQSM